MISFNSRLLQRITKLDSHLCVGLDINPEALSLTNPTLRDVKYHAELVVDATRDLAAAFKPNLAFFERWGSAGTRWLEELRTYIGDEGICIGDAKRGDIGNTARQYALALFDQLGFDAVTVNPFMGPEAIQPFIADPTRGAFVLCRTSNPSADRIQTAGGPENPVYLQVAKMALELNTADNVGLVVGATVAEDLRQVRRVAPNLPLLIPGVGTQGGDLETSYRYGNTGGVALINISRGISFAGDQSSREVRAAAWKYVMEMRALDQVTEPEAPAGHG